MLLFEEDLVLPALAVPAFAGADRVLGMLVIGRIYMHQPWSSIRVCSRGGSMAIANLYFGRDSVPLQDSPLVACAWFSAATIVTPPSTLPIRVGTR